jgi:hypothetical protein
MPLVVKGMEDGKGNVDKRERKRERDVLGLINVPMSSPSRE